MKKTRKKYTLEFNILAASMSIHCGKILDVARELNTCVDTLQYVLEETYKDEKLGLKKSPQSNFDRN
ncbi:hypothetical protein FLACOL7796_04088 [Flavobacterium collinsii]|uniref:Transposase n=1 Tax=Flavobacterium collinsii TaxID=1114861 RepID=A0ABM8KNN3_9FLAO|nr:hypothetical protein FLACOL7796_04088 [Flavobacterium collinsii]